MTHFGFHGNGFRCFNGPQNSFFLQKPLTKDTEIALILVFNESATAKIGLCTYLKPTLNGNFVGWA